MSEHRTFRTSHFGPKLNFEHVEHHKNPKQFANIKLYVSRLVWSHNNRTELRTLPNITFWPKTELRTCRTSQKTEQFANIELFIPRLPFTNGQRIFVNGYSLQYIMYFLHQILLQNTEILVNVFKAKAITGPSFKSTKHV